MLRQIILASLIDCLYNSLTVTMEIVSDDSDSLNPVSVLILAVEHVAVSC